MPSVGMRRRTRVFGARILRSGRRLWVEPYTSTKYGRPVHGEHKYVDNLEKPDHRGESVYSSDMDAWKEVENSISVFPSHETRRKVDAPGVEMTETNADKMFGLVYGRKRKRKDQGGYALAEDKRFRMKFARKDWRRRCRAFESFSTCRAFLDPVSRSGKLCIAIQERSFEFSHWVARLLFSVLSHISRFRIGIRRLCMFLLSKPIFDAYSSLGLHFLEDAFITKSRGICRISGCSSSIPLLYFTFPAIPSVFIYMQTSIYFRNVNLDYLLLLPSPHAEENDDEVPHFIGNDEESFSRMSCDEDFLVVPSEIYPGRRNEDIKSRIGNYRETDPFQPPVVPSKSAIRSMQLRSRRKIQKRRSFLGRRRGLSISAFRGQKGRGALITSKEKIKQLKSVTHVVSQSERIHCFANLLVSDAEKCYREEGVMISLEPTVSQCFIVIRKDGMKTFSFMPQRVMKLCSSNRFTHSIVWGETDSWKLEFLTKKDWINFKDLYKECFKHNRIFHADTVIPVPRVQDINSDDTYYVPFARPDAYISVKDDELIRALGNKSSNYDMDSDDERWLAKLNNDLAKGKLQEVVTPDSFEFAIDAFEKSLHSNPLGKYGEQAVDEFISRRDVVDTIQNYWIEKRKQKRTALIKIFQLYQPRRSQVTPKSILRKKRSFKRPGSQRVISKQCSPRQVMPTVQEEVEQQNNAQRFQEAAAAADRLEEVAILNRLRAQDMMVNADLSTYKALMALRIAEAAQITDSPGAFASTFIG